MQYTAQHIASVIAPGAQLAAPQQVIEFLLTDSRQLLQPSGTLFFALSGLRRQGSLYVQELYDKGVRNFVVPGKNRLGELAGANLFVVPDVLQALQQLAAYHRSRFGLPVVGITGSNGKTIVKEWLYQLLHDDYHIVRSPRSYNSQIGVPLSVWQLNEQHNLALFEAGISQPGEMQNLQRIIKPTIGVFTNIGEAHNAGFLSVEQKIAEKAVLFAGAEVVVTEESNAQLLPQQLNFFTWGRSAEAAVQVQHIKRLQRRTEISFRYKDEDQTISIPFTDDASVHNALTCCAVLCYLGLAPQKWAPRFAKLHPVDMRLHFFQGINGCSIINDSYSADLTSLYIALNFLKQQNTAPHRTVILSDFVESGKSDEALYKDIASALTQYNVRRVIGVGEKISALLSHYLAPGIAASFYLSTEDFLQHFITSQFQQETILIKGARKFSFERIAQLFEQKVHQTVLQINLSAMVHNLKQYQQLLQPGTKLMAMVKAFSYGSGGAEIASVLQHNNVDYLGVAYTDEGVDLRKSGIRLPIMVINADESSFAALVDFSLQPVLYSFELLHQFEDFIRSQGLTSYPVHIEVETGMNRLGFAVNDMPALAGHMHQSGLLKVESVFSHLAASEDPAQDAFTQQQARLLNEATAVLKNVLPYSFLQHIANSAAIVRHPQLQMDMVRLGIGLYGIETVPHRLELQPVATLRSTIAQLKHLKPGETVSYNRRGLVTKDTTIATVRIGYADGYARRFSNGVGKMWVRGRLAPVIGTVCMDMTMIDVTDVAGVQEGDEVLIFGKDLPVQQVAQWAGTIPYEVMTAVSQRVKRVYFQE